MLLAILAAGPSQAQLPALPGLPSGLPSTSRLPVDAGLPEFGALPRDIARAVDLRRLRLRDLIRGNRDVIDVDDKGAPVVRGELLLVAPEPASLARAAAAGFTILRETTVEGTGVRLVTLTLPRGLDARRAIKTLRRADPDGDYDFNHIYSPAGAVAATAMAPVLAPAAVASPRRVGLVDTGIDAGHRSFSGARVEQRGFAPGGVRAGAHGTAAASLLVGQAGAFRGAAPGAGLMVADVYGGGPTGGSAEAIARGLGWLAASDVPVINVSLVGPPNAILKAVVRDLSARGVLIVAAVGNDGPAAPPLYPASYAEVIAVTGVDGRDRVLLEAGRASHLDFAAPGADMAAAGPGDGFVTVRGTSFAAPIVAGQLAALRTGPGKADARAAVDALARQARDLGAPGPDRVYGRGLVGDGLRTSPRAVGAGPMTGR
ncbi:MAG: S8 family serine peptidase [Caulobacter sp.]|nr:S8 family serine peptidase [Caulobacter sp.]